jgi:integrase
MKSFQSLFAPRLRDYVRLRRGLGLQFRGQADILFAFDRFVREQQYEEPLTQDLALAFATANAGATTTECARRYQVVRHFSDYLATFDPQAPRLDPQLIRRPRVRRPPAHIYTEEELAQLLHEARHVSHRHPLRGITLHAMVGLAASTGLRISEVVKLDKSDVDLDIGTLVVRQSKFAKDRLVPLHPTTRDVLRSYAAVRDTAFPDAPCPAFFLHLWGRRFSRHTLQMAFWELTRRTGLRSGRGRGPSFHDLRHTFAVRRLVVWYRAGLDVQAKLPALATYMGHVHYSDTAYYLQATAELLDLAADRLQMAYEEALP